MSLTPEDRLLLERVERALCIIAPLVTGKKTLAQHARELGISVSCLKMRRKRARLQLRIKEARV